MANKNKNYEDLMMLNMWNYNCVNVFKSIRRSIRRGLVTETGAIAPKRPFNNRKNSCKRKNKHSRLFNEIKRNIYEQYRSK